VVNIWQLSYNYIMQRERGSALVIAVLLVSAIGAIAFGFGRVFLAGLFNMTISSDGIYAYYSAESGMEEAFLRYRYDMNAEVPFDNWTLGPPAQDKVFRSDLSGNAMISSSNDGMNKTALISDFSKQIYDLRMGYLGTDGLPFWGDDPFPLYDGNGKLEDNDLSSVYYGDSNQALTVAKDESVKIDLSDLSLDNLTDNDLLIYAKMSDPAGNPPLASKAMVEAKLTVDLNGDGSQVNEYKTVISRDPVTSCTLLGRDAASTPDNNTCVAELMQATLIPGAPGYYVWQKENLIASWRSSIGLPAFGSETKATLFLKPLYYDAQLGIVTSDCKDGLDFCSSPTKSGIIPGPSTFVTSTGYYGGISRTLAADIDRQSGTLYDLFDYVIYDFN